jgi:hypothetical protein
MSAAVGDTRRAASMVSHQEPFGGAICQASAGIHRHPQARSTRQPGCVTCINAVPERAHCPGPGEAGRSRRPLLRHRGGALVFDSIEEYHEAATDPDLAVDESSVLVVGGAGPKGYPGMAGGRQLRLADQAPRTRSNRHGQDFRPEDERHRIRHGRRQDGATSASTSTTSSKQTSAPTWTSSSARAAARYRETITSERKLADLPWRGSALDARLSASTTG